MLIREYLKITEKTDQLEPRTPTHPNFKLMPILGLAGEIGSLLTELKKEVREPQRRADLGTKRLEEELGDIIWYATTIARRARLEFERDVLFANLVRIQNDRTKYLPFAESANDSIDSLRDVVATDGERSVETFDAYQKSAAKSATLGRDDAALIPYLARIWRNSGELLELVDATKFDFSDADRQEIAEALGDVMWYAAGFATLYGLSLSAIAMSNAEKAQSMFMPEAERTPSPLYDGRYRPLEQFPRKFNVDFVSMDDETAVMLISGVRIGDPLKDNAYQREAGFDGMIDGYRFHDCVHLAFVSVLGWSPVVRNLMKRKRKSDKRVDDAEDGARAQIVEEMIVKLTHSYAVGVDPIQLLKGRRHVSMDLLKQIELIAEGLEVRANKLWEWEKAILDGYQIFADLRCHRGGRIAVDLRKRSVAFTALRECEGERFPEPE
jgi:NTP pyrophosphatase (non-canonical NTP hydrolase)